MSDDPESVVRKTPQHLEDEASHRLVTDLSPRIDAFQRRWASGDRDVARRSSLAGDDRHSQPFHLSHAASHAISHAVDDLDALRVLIVPGEGTQFTVVSRPYGAYPLIRAAVENASAALWVLGADTRDARITRRFRLLLTDAGHRDEIVSLTGVGVADTRGRRLAVVRSLVKARGLDLEECQRRVGYSTIIREAAAVVGGDSSEALAIWRTLSGPFRKSFGA